MSLVLFRRLSRFTCYNEPSLILSARNFASTPGPKKYTREKVRQDVKGYVFTRYIDYVKNYDKILEKKFPKAVRVYRIFFEGVRDFYKDMKHYLKITRIANSSSDGLRALTRSELELYLRMPKDMVKVAPALLLSALPFVGYVVFPVAYMYPKIFLTSHFWSLQQKAEFKNQYLRDRLCNNRRVFRCLQAKLESIKEELLYKKLKHILGLLGSGVHPTIDEILYVKDLFTQPPYDFNSLSSKHIKYLCHQHGIHGIFFRRIKLVEHAYIIHHMDLAIVREGDVQNMLPDALKLACYIRGLNPTNMSNESMIEWLRKWIKVSLAITEEHLSLFLHLPILIGYNHPSNWRLIYI